jgi:probable O-glycosylation ligase (exosortase A-associated)
MSSPNREFPAVTAASVSCRRSKEAHERGDEALRAILLTGLVLAIVPAILLHPFVGVLVWTWLSLMNPHKLAFGFARTFPYAQIVGIATLIAMMNGAVKKRWPLTRESVVLLFFVFWMVVTTVFALNPEPAWEQLDKVVKVQLIVFVTMALLTTRKQIELLIWVMVLSIGFYGAKGGLFTLATGGRHHVRGPSKSFISGDNHLALALIMILPLMYYFWRVNSNRGVRLAMMAWMVLTAVATVGTQSRGALLGLAAVLLLLVLKGRRRVFALALVLGVAYLTSEVMPQKWFDRMDTIRTFEEDGSAMGRINAWQFAFNLAQDRPIGGGFMCFTRRLFLQYAPDPQDFHDAHSIYFEVLGEHGFVGLFLFLLLAGLTWQTCRTMIKGDSQHPNTFWASELARMIQVSMVGYGVAGAFVGLAYFDLYYNLIAVIVAAKFVVADELQQLQESEVGGAEWGQELTPLMR